MIADTSHDATQMFLRAEQSGLKLAIKGRTVALLVLGVGLVWTRARDPERALDYALVISAFVALGLAHYALIGTRFDRRWLKYVFITLDIAIVSVLIATQPLFPTTPDLPAVRRTQRAGPGGDRARGARVPDCGGDVARPQHAAAATGSGTGPGNA